MSTLLMTLSSDEEDSPPGKTSNNDDDEMTSTTDENQKKNGEGKGSKRKGGRKNKNTKKKDRNEDEDEDEYMEDDFEFGGLLGEDGDANQIPSLHSSTPDSVAWSYRSALKILEENDGGRVGTKVARTDVASIIAAARSNLKKREQDAESSSNDKRDVEDDDDSGDDSSRSDSDQSDESANGDDGNDDGSTSGSGSDSDSESSDDEVDDVETTKNMPQDSLILRENPSTTDASTKTTPSSPSHSTESESEGEEELRKEARRAEEYFESTVKGGGGGGDGNDEEGDEVEVFVQLNLSRPLLRGVAAMGFVKPTPIQAKVIPVALCGRDVCASAVTGSGKTAAFLLPIMERILQRGGGRIHLSTSSNRSNATRGAANAATKALVMTPTRELAAQCLGMMTAMAKFTSLRAALIVGGAKNVAAQATELRTRPDVVIATPGRLLDHLTNSSGVDLDDLEFLVLDEADRLLDLGFQDEVHEIVKSCPTQRQTLLFSATMGTKVDELVKLSLKRPVRVHITEKNRTTANSVEVAERLEQEFVRIRSSHEGTPRKAILLALLTRTFQSRTIVFFDTKADAHQLMIICGLCGIRCAELHGNLTQVQRLEALEKFREGGVDVLLATDLAARGLDISSVETVVNFEMPSTVETYVHRIGRTARAGRGGRACTLIGEGRRRLMKEVIRDAGEKRKRIEGKGLKDSAASSTGVIRSRTVPQAVLAHFVAKINSLEPHIKEVIAAEAVAKMDRIAEMEAMKVENLIQHGDEIKSRPQREWFATSKQKLSTKEAAALKQQQILAKVGTGMHRMTRKKRRVRDAQRDLLEAQMEAEEEARENGREVKQKVLTDTHQKMSVKAQKRDIEKKSNAKYQESVADLDDNERKKAKKKQKTSKKRKGVFASDALGDAGLYQEETISHVETSKDEDVPKSNYNFRGFDPNMQRKNKKKSVKAFKSKSKYKRR